MRVIATPGQCRVRPGAGASWPLSAPAGTQAPHREQTEEDTPEALWWQHQWQQQVGLSPSRHRSQVTWVQVPVTGVLIT